MAGSLVELTIRYGEYGHEAKTVSVPISERLTRELLCSVELSDEPLSLLLASPGLFGGKGSAVTVRRRAFTMRRWVAEHIAKAMVPELMRLFGVNDRGDGYRIEEMTDGEREHYRRLGGRNADME